MLKLFQMPEFHDLCWRDQKKFQNSSGKAARRGLMLQKEWRVKTVFTELEIIWLGKNKQTNRERKRSKFAHKHVRTHQAVFGWITRGSAACLNIFTLGLNSLCDSCPCGHPAILSSATTFLFFIFPPNLLEAMWQKDVELERGGRGRHYQEEGKETER